MTMTIGRVRARFAYVLVRCAMTFGAFGGNIDVFDSEEAPSMSRFMDWENIMSAHTYKMIELVGSSTEGTDHAIRDAIAKAALTVKHMDWYEVVESRGHIAGGKVAHYQVTIKVGFRLE